METKSKLELLRGQLRTKELIENLPKLEDNLERALADQALNRNTNSGYLAAYGSDCQVVKDILSTLTPPAEIDGKKTTVDSRAAWLTAQRKTNADLIGAISTQNVTSFTIENDRNLVEIAREKISNARAILAVRTAQMNFLAGDIIIREKS